MTTLAQAIDSRNLIRIMQLSDRYVPIKDLLIVITCHSRRDKLDTPHWEAVLTLSSNLLLGASLAVSMGRLLLGHLVFDEQIHISRAMHTELVAEDMAKILTMKAMRLLITEPSDGRLHFMFDLEFSTDQFSQQRLRGFIPIKDTRGLFMSKNILSGAYNMI